MAEITLTSTFPASPARAHGRRLDPRFYQIAVLASLLAYGKLALRFDVGFPQILVLLSSALAVQWLGGRFVAHLPFDPKSALISALSLCLLLRTDSLPVAALAAAIAIGSKFVLRIRGKHVFNPTNLAIVVVVLTTNAAWVSPGQWGAVAFFAFLMACLGGLVVHRAARSDVTYAFLAFHAAILFGRALRLGDPLTIPLHQLESGALLLFSFFMISDPKTTPDSRAGRILFAALVAAGAWYVQFKLFRPNGLLFSLAVMSLAVPLIDWVLPGERYAWSKPTAGGRSTSDCSGRAPARPSSAPTAELTLGRYKSS
jgi:enediyne biosynthesis protein E5